MTDPTPAGVSDADISGDVITSPRSPWELRHNAICDELLRTRALLREHDASLSAARLEVERLRSTLPFDVFIAIGRVIEASKYSDYWSSMVPGTEKKDIASIEHWRNCMNADGRIGDRDTALAPVSNEGGETK